MEKSLVLSVSAGTGYYRHIQISEGATLYGLHEAILNSFCIYDCHLHSFFMNNRAWDSDMEYISPNAEIDGEVGFTDKVKLSELNLNIGKKFLYIYDYGDSRRFNIKVLHIINEKTAKPVVLRRKGELMQFRNYGEVDEEEKEDYDADYDDEEEEDYDIADDDDDDDDDDDYDDDYDDDDDDGDDDDDDGDGDGDDDDDDERFIEFIDGVREREQLFDKYNPAYELPLVEPAKKKEMRQILHNYAVAMTVLYGVISKKEFLEIYKNHGNEPVSESDLAHYLLPMVHKSHDYCFYMDYLINGALSENFDEVRDLLREQGGKQRFMPEKEELLKYADPDYDDGAAQWVPVRESMVLMWGNNRNTIDAYKELRNYVSFNDSISDFTDILNRHELEFDSLEELNKFIKLTMDARNSMRMWENKGFTPIEMFEKEYRVRHTPAQRKEFVGRNDPCPCGSGRKYKTCCGR